MARVDLGRVIAIALFLSSLVAGILSEIPERDVVPYLDTCNEHERRLLSSTARLVWSDGPDGAMALMAICHAMGLWPARVQNALEFSR